MARRFVLPQRPGPRLRVDFRGELNEQQYAAVTSGEGPKLVIAGAGTGKTRTLTYRVAWLISQGVAPDRILLVTFTNKAAREMIDRVQRLTGLETFRLWGGTFHSVGARVLRKHADRIGYSESFSILDESDQRDLLRLCVTDAGVEVERRRFPSPRVLASLISMHANTGEPLADVLADRYGRFADWEEEIASIAERYRERKRAANAMDYDDLLVLWLRLLEEHPSVLEAYGRQWKHILVDEYQDTNLVQGRVVETLAGANGNNLMVVGDDCQSIYAFRGAHYDNILSFPDRNEGTEIFRLEINYRSTPEILELTNTSIRNNTGQYDKELEARRGSGMMPALVPCNYAEQEAAFVAERILQLRDEGTPLSEVAILYRAHSHRLSIETTLLRYDIPYEIRGGVRFFEQAHVKDVVAYLRLAHNPRDEMAFRRAILLQPGIGNVTAGRLWEAFGGDDELLARLADPALRERLPSRARDGWKGFSATLQAVLEAASEPEEAIRTAVADYSDLAAAKFTNAESRLEDLEQLAIFASQYDGVGELLEELVLLGEMYGQDVHSGPDEEEGRVVLSTVHQAKGLEWDAVFLVHLVEGALPSPRALDEPGGEEEERRIFYVATTRARSELYLSYPIVRAGGGRGSLLQQASRFVQELPVELVESWELFEADSASASGSAERPGAPDGGERAFGSDPEPEYDPNVDPVWNDEDFPQ